MAAITRDERQRRDALYLRGLKACTWCAAVLPVADYGPRKDGYQGLDGACRPCRNTATAQRQRRDPQRHAARVRRWCSTNRDRVRATAKHYRDSHPLDERLRAGRHRAEQRGLRADRITADELLVDWRRRGIDPDTCVYTGEPLRDGWHLDHVYPLSMAGTPGHVVTNLVPTNRSVNLGKGRRGLVDFLADRCRA